MTFKEFLMHVILIILMTLGCVYAAREGMLSAIKTVDERQTVWSVARGER